MMNQLHTDCALVVSSCDAYSDLWKPFFTLLFRYWPDCPFPIYLISNKQIYWDKRVRPLLIGIDKRWATNTRRTLERIPEPYILWILEDLFLEKPTNTNYILKLLDYLKFNHAATIRLHPTPIPDEDFENDLNLGRIGHSADYRTSLNAAIWDKQIFYHLIREGENPWQMEVDGTKRSRDLSSTFLSVKSAALNYNQLGATIRRKWRYEAILLCQREKISVDYSCRPIAYADYILRRLDFARKISFARCLRAIPVVGPLIRDLLALTKRVMQ